MESIAMQHAANESSAGVSSAYTGRIFTLPGYLRGITRRPEV